MKKNNPYLKEIEKVLPRILSLIDNDTSNDTYGLLDRLYWGWKLIDFPNGTPQGVINGFARLWVNGIWPYETKKELFINRISSIIYAASKITRYDGSLEEAFPYEGSYCVTALIAYDTLVTIDLLTPELSTVETNEWLNIVESWINFLIKSDEEHALISNHLATAAAALFRWAHIADGRNSQNLARQKGELLLKRILFFQSEKEGWFKEYEGADGGYQSLCTYYLADLLENLKKYSNLENQNEILIKKLSEALEKSLDFLKYNVNPDGSFGGIHGSRNTRIYCPGGLELLSDKFLIARLISKRMESSINNMEVVNLSTIDFGNLSPIFNSYCMAAVIWEKRKNNKDHLNISSLNNKLPCDLEKTHTKYFPETGIYIHSAKRQYTVISISKGGTVMHFRCNKLSLINCGVRAKINKLREVSTQAWNIDNKFSLNKSSITITSQFYELKKSLPSPSKFIVLRILGLSIFKIRFIKEFFKRILVNLLIKNKKRYDIYNKRTIIIGEKITIKDEQLSKRKLYSVDNNNYFISIHMASQGYWQIQDEGS